MRPFGTPSFALASVLACTACGPLLGADDYHAAPTDSGGDQPRLLYANAECGQCAARSCKQEWDACERDPACVAFSNCFSGCTSDDGACQGRCVDHASSKSGTWGALFGCETLECASVCGDCTSGFAISGGERCATCVGQDTGPSGVCEQRSACAEDAECVAYAACLFSECQAFAPDPRCRLACGGRHPAGARLLTQGVGTRSFQTCQAECRGGQQWDCAQPAAWPAPRKDTALVTLHPASAMAHACRNLDLSCSSPIAGTPQDAADATVFELTAGTTPDSGYYFESSPEAQPKQLFLPWQPLVGDIGLWIPGLPDFNGGLDAAVTARGGSVDFQNLGVVVASVVDCVGGLADFGSPTPSTTVTATPGEPAYYTASGAALDASLTGGGIAVLVNLSPPSTSLEVRRNGSPIARAVVPVRAGRTTQVTFNYPQY